MDKIVEEIIENINKAGLVQVEISARHVHLSKEDLRILFGAGAKLTPKRELSQPNQFLCEERVNIIGTKGSKNNVAILGPLRENTQVELSKSDCIELGVKAPIRESGDLDETGTIILEGPCGRLTISQGVIIAQNHIHVPCDIANTLNLKDKERVNVQIFSERPVIFTNVIIRISENFRFRMHIDFDEANAAEINGFVLGKIMQKSNN